MTKMELDTVLAYGEDYLEWQTGEKEDGRVWYNFRDLTLPYYRNNPENFTSIREDILFSPEFTESRFWLTLHQGLQVEGMTRVTGYFAKTSGWNPGKRGELKDRKKWDVMETNRGIQRKEVTCVDGVCKVGK